MSRADEIRSGLENLGELAQMAFRHVEAEDAGDMEGTLATFEEDATFDLYPCGLRLSGRDRIRRYYEYFFSVARQRCIDYVVHGHFYGETGFSIEITVTVRYDDGQTRDFRTITIFPYGKTALRGERLYADSEFLRVIFGPLFAEMEPLAP